jgi:Ca2+-binding EF-hand superfamily protein
MLDFPYLLILQRILRCSGFKYLFKALKTIVNSFVDERRQGSIDNQYLKKMWDKADADHSGTLTKDEIIRVVAKMNIYTSIKNIEEMYAKVSNFNRFGVETVFSTGQ